MAGSWRWGLIIAALVAGMLLVGVSCGGEEEEPTATATVEEEATPPEEGEATPPEEEEATPPEGGGGAVEPGEGEAFADVPLPEGADEVSTATFSGSQAAGLIPLGADVDVEQYTQAVYKTYDVDGSPEDVINFYKDRQGDWEESFSFSSEDGGLVVWTRDGGARAVWISTSAGSEAGTTSLFIWEATIGD